LTYSLPARPSGLTLIRESRRRGLLSQQPVSEVSTPPAYKVITPTWVDARLGLLKAAGLHVKHMCRHMKIGIWRGPPSGAEPYSTAGHARCPWPDQNQVRCTRQGDRIGVASSWSDACGIMAGMAINTLEQCRTHALVGHTGRRPQRKQVKEAHIDWFGRIRVGSPLRVRS
jgi:hypothetical protein